jgi:hypothetical protein
MEAGELRFRTFRLEIKSESVTAFIGISTFGASVVEPETDRSEAR